MPGPTIALLFGTAMAEPDASLCDALLQQPPDATQAMDALAAGALWSTRCPRQVTVPVDRELSMPEWLLGVLVPPFGIAMMLEGASRTEVRTQHPSPLDLAIESELPSVVEALLAAGADPLQAGPDGDPVPLVTAVATDLRVGGNDWTRMILEDHGEIPPLILARQPAGLDALLGHPELLQPLLEAGLDGEGLDADGGTWLTRAAREGASVRVEAALSLGASPANPTGRRAPITVASEHRHSGIVVQLLAAGAEPTDEAVLAAARHRDPESLLPLLAAGGDPNAEGPFCRRPLHHALKDDNDALVDALLDAGADPGRRATSNIFEEPPPIHMAVAAGDAARVQKFLPHVEADILGEVLTTALRSKHLGLAEVLLAAGARPDDALLLLGSAEDEEARAWLRARGARVSADALAAVVEISSADAVREAIADGAAVDVPGGVPSHLPAEIALERADIDVLAVLVAAGAPLPVGMRADSFVQHGSPDVLEAALELGAIADHRTVRTAVYWGRPEALEALARHVDDPAAWKPRRLGRGPLRARAEEIHAEKRRTARERPLREKRSDRSER